MRIEQKLLSCFGFVCRKMYLSTRLENVFDGCAESSSLELNMQDRKICFYCPTRTKGRKDALWYFNIVFAGKNGESLFLPGQILVNSDEVYRKTVGGKLPFVEILEKIKLKTTDETV